MFYDTPGPGADDNWKFEHDPLCLEFALKPRDCQWQGGQRRQDFSKRPNEIRRRSRLLSGCGAVRSLVLGSRGLFLAQHDLDSAGVGSLKTNINSRTML